MKKNSNLVAKLLLATIVLVAGMGLTAYAGEWQQNSTGWQYHEDNGSYSTNCWQWIDGNGDGVAECYYFDGNGYMLSNTTTPDGYQVDASGAWTELGIVRTKAVTDTTPIEDRNIATSEIPSGYNENGLSNVAIDLLEHTRAENAAKYGENKVEEMAGDYIVWYNNTDFLVQYPYNNDNDKPALVQADRADELFKEAPMTDKADTDKDILRKAGYKAVSDGGITVVDMERYELQLKSYYKNAELYIKFSYK